MILAEDVYAFQSVAFNPSEPRLVAVGNTRYGAALFDSRQRKRYVLFAYKELNSKLIRLLLLLQAPALQEHDVGAGKGRRDVGVLQQSRHPAVHHAEAPPSHRV